MCHHASFLCCWGLNSEPVLARKAPELCSKPSIQEVYTFGPYPDELGPFALISVHAAMRVLVLVSGHTERLAKLQS